MKLYSNFACKLSSIYMEMKIYLSDADNMTEMVNIPIFGKNTLKYFTLEPVEIDM